MFFIYKIYGIIQIMRIRILPFIIGLITVPAYANWQYSGEYTYDMSAYDTGERVAVSLRGGASWAMAKVKNDLGSIVYSYCVDTTTGAIYLAESGTNPCPGAVSAGTGNIGSLGATKLSEFSFSAGASVGWILPNNPQWRLELGWDHFAEVDYNESPLFSGNLHLTGGYTTYAETGAVQSTMSTDVISAMAFYDFFDGLYKPMRQIIPYMGFGVGYADTKTVMNLSDPWGDLSQVADLINFGTLNDLDIIQFNRATTNTNNIAGIAAIGLSYGMNKNLFIDFGARVTYLPRVKYQLVNADDTRRMDLFSLQHLVYTNIMLGVRLEF